MTTRVPGFAALVVLFVFASSWGSVTGSPAAQQKPHKQTPPDIQGVWGNAELGTWTVWLEPQKYLASMGMPRMTGRQQSNSGPIPMPTMKIRQTAILDPENGILPYQPWALERRNSVMKNYITPKPWQMDTQTPGWPTGIPREHSYSSVDGSYGGPIQILQSAGYVLFLYETHHEFRYVPLDGRPQPGQDIKMWLGSSRGRWEGDTLVIDVWNNNDSPRMTVIGDFHSDEMRATERWRLLDKNTLEYRVTIDDPRVFTKPWTLGMTFTRAPADTQLFEYAGVEGSTGLLTIQK